LRDTSVESLQLAVDDGMMVVAKSDRKTVSPALAAGRSMGTVQTRDETSPRRIEQVDRKVFRRHASCRYFSLRMRTQPARRQEKFSPPDR
jgi:hypothetical protein